MFYLTGCLRTWNSVSNEGLNYYNKFPGWGKKFIIPLRDNNSIILQDYIAAVEFNLSGYFLVNMNLDKCYAVTFKVLDINSLELVEKSTENWVSVMDPQLLNKHNGLKIYLKMPLIKEGVCSFD